MIFYVQFANSKNTLRIKLWEGILGR